MKSVVTNTGFSFHLILAALLILFQHVGAQVIYVGPDEEYTNIKWALGQAIDGDTIIVRDGVYLQDIKVRRSVVLMAENLHGAVIGNESDTVARISVVPLDSTDGVVIEGFKFVAGELAAIVVGDGNPEHKVKNCVLRNNHIEYRGRGIRVTQNVTNLEISGNTIKGCKGDGINHMGVGKNIISGNLLEECEFSGIFLPEQHGGSFTITNNSIKNNQGSGIGIERSDVLVEGNSIEGNQFGINTNCGRSGIVVRDSNKVFNNIIGIGIECGTIATIENNDISGNGEHGIDNRGITDIFWNIIKGNGGMGISSPSGSPKIKNNHISSNGTDGIGVDFGAENVEINGNNIEDNNESGIILNGSAAIDGNTIKGNRAWGIFIPVGSATISNNLINSNGIHGIEIGPESESMLIGDNEISSNQQLGVMTAMGAILRGNLINGNGAEGILITPDAIGVEIRDSNVISNNMGHEILLAAGSSTFISKNTIESDTVILSEEDIFHGIYIEGSARIENNLIRKINGSGIYLHETARDVNITGQNQIKANRKGIMVLGQAIINNNIFSENLEHAVRIGAPAQDVTLTWNKLVDNYTGAAVLSGTSNVTFRHNTISNNVRGMFSTGAPVLRNNTIQGNLEYGIKIRRKGIDLGNSAESDSGFNAILDNAEWNVINEDSLEIQAFWNYWGLNDSAEIDSTIKDNDEDSLTGPVIFEPFLMDYNVGVRQSQRPGNTYQDDEILQVYPNPVSGNATIQFILNSTEEVNLYVIDVSGRIIQSLVSGRNYEPGEHTLQWNRFSGEGKMIPDGIYYVVMKTGQQIISRKVLLVR